MASISSPGVGSGLDVKSIVSQLVALERRPIEKLQQEKSTTEARLSSFGLLQSYTNNLRDAAKKLALPGTWAASAASSSDTDYVGTTTTTGSASAGSFSVSVSQLARAQSVASNPFPSSASTFGAGSLTLQLGQWTAGTPPGFTAKSGTTPVNVSVDAGDSLATIKDRINDANASVRASIVNDGSGARLVIRSQATGEVNAVKITSTGDASLNDLAYSPDEVPTGTMAETISALDARAIINGLTVNSDSNTLSGVIDGVTLTLKQPTLTAVEVTVAPDTAAMRKAVEDFTKAFNELNGYITEQTKYDPEKKVAGKLQGESATRTLQSQLRSMMQAVSGASATFSTLSTLGIEVQRGGGLKVNDTRFNAAMADPAALSTAFTADAADDANDGFGVRFTTLTTSLTDGEGLLQRRADGIRSQIKRQETEVSKLETRVTSIEARLLQQYSALDSNLGRLNGLGSYVSQQVTAWNNSKG
jgi:flagellar hook-associated protein 2